jgi:UDP-N-acetylglucosamine:LPS N-acetylglucosamine transferase
MGGFSTQHQFVGELEALKDVVFVIPGASQVFTRQSNLILLPHCSDFFHPDLINASDLVVAKLGYSTVAETYHAGVPMGYVRRNGFRESDILASFVEQQMDALSFTEAEFAQGRWIAELPKLLAMPRNHRVSRNGSSEVAHFINSL